jgi:hypothetical protein
MSVSLAGLDLSWLSDPANRLPPSPPKQRTNFQRARSDLPCPSFMADIEPFVSIATRDTVEITSRSQLREYERANGIKQCGELKGKVIPEQKARIAKETYVSPEDKAAADFKWVD